MLSLRDDFHYLNLVKSECQRSQLLARISLKFQSFKSVAFHYTIQIFHCCLRAYLLKSLPFLHLLQTYVSCWDRYIGLSRIFLSSYSMSMSIVYCAELVVWQLTLNFYRQRLHSVQNPSRPIDSSCVDRQLIQRPAGCRLFSHSVSVLCCLLWTIHIITSHWNWAGLTVSWVQFI